MAVSDLTIAEVAEVESLSGQPFADLGDPKAPKGRLMQSIVYVMRRKTDSSFSFEQAGLLTMDEMSALMEGSDPLPNP